MPTPTRRQKLVLTAEEQAAKLRRRRAAFGIIVGMTCAYLGFAYWFICLVTSPASVQVVSAAGTKTGESEDTTIDDEYYRRQARITDARLQAELEERNEPVQPPDMRPYDRWYARVQQIEAQLAELEPGPEGTIYYELQQSLERLKQDRPER